ncbi:MAG: ABC transporter permease [Chloroflexota bacterium]|nr:ABC transporter permease [Chloroflexota bacterium]
MTRATPAAPEGASSITRGPLGSVSSAAAPVALRAAADVALPLSAGDRAMKPTSGFWTASVRRLLKNKVAMAALLTLVALYGICFAAPLIERATGLQRDAIELLDNYQAPSLRHPFGTDENGRDYFIRLLYGGQISILMGLSVTLIVLVISIPVGLAAGYYGGRVDGLFLWVVQILNSVPTLFVLILVATWIPPSPLSLALIIGAFGWTGDARQARGLTLSLKRTDYVLAARAVGASDVRIMFRHIMPNIISLMIVLAGFSVIAGILAEVSLSFLGLGVRPPLPSWGNMLTNSLSYTFKAPYLVVFPGLAVGTVVLCVYMLADGLRDAFDPRLKQ